VAPRRGDIPAARRELVSAQRLRHLLTYASPQLAIQARMELIRVHLALADLAGARTLMREVDELRILPLLATHLPAAEIAAELFVSVHTVKSQQASLYRKLGTSSRSQAVTRARQLGLLEG
jgi:LuxR family transcriptional regulator, maltose regulon positive regulatory protein